MLPSKAADAGLLARPVVVVVPSRTLRAHLAARLVAARGRAVAGVRFVTLYGLALEIVGRLGAPPRAGAEVLPVLVARAVREERELRGLVESLDEALPPVVAAVRDLLDAGVQGGHLEALDERLAELSPEDPAAGRARAVLRVAGAAGAGVERLRIGVPAAVLREAADALRRDPEEALPCRAVLVHGFADATGVATDLIEALVRFAGAVVLLATPPDPAAPERREAGVGFAARFRWRIESVCAAEVAEGAAAPPRIAAFRAHGSHAEIREVARRIRELLERGTEPEAVGIVARDLEPYRVAIRLHFGRLGIPFATAGARGMATAASRRVAALLAVLARGAEAPVDAWLAAAARRGMARLDVRVGLRALRSDPGRRRGGARRRQRAGGRQGVVAADADAVWRRGAGTTSRMSARPGPRGEPVAGRAAAHGGRGWLRATLAALARASRGQRRAAPTPVQCARSLGVRSAGAAIPPERTRWRATLARLAGGLPPELALDRDEFRRRARGAARGGRPRTARRRGRQLRVLDVTEARGLTFGHLFLIGLNRDSFPRQVRDEDPLLPDRVPPTP